MAQSSGARWLQAPSWVDDPSTAASLELVVPPASFYARRGKRAFDLVVSTLLVVVTSPIMAVVGLAVLARLGRPLLYPQQRVGRHGRQFTIFKFRTMEHDRRLAQVNFSGPERRTVHKSGDDPRHTRVGRLLRKTSIDELPQLFNVIKGDMSLVGPRPEMWSLGVEHDLLDHPRHSVRPGITGPRQVSAERGAKIYTDPDFDLAYVTNVSLGTDLRLLAATVVALVKATGE